MRISDWSPVVVSSDLVAVCGQLLRLIASRLTWVYLHLHRRWRPTRGEATRFALRGPAVELSAVATQCLPVSEPMSPRVAPAPRPRSAGSHSSVYRSSQPNQGRHAG